MRAGALVVCVCVCMYVLPCMCDRACVYVRAYVCQFLILCAILIRHLYNNNYGNIQVCQCTHARARTRTHTRLQHASLTHMTSLQKLSHQRH